MAWDVKREYYGILSVVTFQILVSGILPRISYPTLLSAFLYINYLVLFAGVVENLAVGHLDRSGNVSAGNRLDRVSRWGFPVAYVALPCMAGSYFMLFH